MLHLIKEYYKNPDEEKINFPIINREYEKDLHEYITACFSSITRVLNEIHLTKSEFVIDVDKVNQGSYERSRGNTVKQKQYCYIQESMVGELRLHFHVDMEYEGKITPLEYDVKLLIPIPDDDGYYYIKGNRYILQYQLTESSTYTTSSELVEKSLLPIKIKKAQTEAKTIDGKVLVLNMYKVLVFRRYENPFYFYLATMGWSNTLEYFNVGEYISTIPEPDGDPAYTYIKVSNSVTIKVLTRALEVDYIQSILGNICSLCNNRLTMENLEDKYFWTCKIGAFKQNTQKESHYELGKRHIILFNRMLDDATVDNLRLTDYNKRDVYAIIRWLIQNFKILWQKDNLNILNKRLRCNEYVASFLNDIISERIKRFVNAATASTIDKQIAKYNQFFAYRGNEVISKLHSSGLMRYDDMVNDMDLFQKMKVTSKGPNSAGNKSNSKTVTSSRRGLDPSHLRRLDINFCSTSDPGLTNYLTLACETDGLYFKDSIPEPETFYYDLKNELGEVDDDNCPILVVDPIKYNLLLDTISDCHIKRKRVIS